MWISAAGVHAFASRSVARARALALVARAPASVGRSRPEAGRLVLRSVLAHACGLAVALCALAGALASPIHGQEAWPGPDPELLERARALLREVPLIDGHNDLPTSLIETYGTDLGAVDLAERHDQLSADIPRLREGMVGGQFFSVWSDSETMHSGTALSSAMEELDVIHGVIERYPELELALTADDVERIHREGRIAAMIGIEGGHMIENSLGNLRLFHRLGARYMTLSHFGNTDWSDAATDMPVNRGLTEFGEEVVREMNRVGLFVDLSHVSPGTMEDALRVSEAPVIFSHSGARAVNAHVRNVPDDVLERLPENGGVVMVDFIAGYVVPTPPAWRERAGPEGEEMHLRARLGSDAPHWATRRDSVAEALRVELDDTGAVERALAEWIRQNPPPRGTLGDVADHIDHIVRVAGVDHVGIGSDYYDAGESSMAHGLEDVTRFPHLLAELLRRGYSDEDVKKIAGLNVLRAMRQMEEVAQRLQRERGPSRAVFP